MAAKRELIDAGTDKRYVRRDEQGQFQENDDVGRSSAADQRHDAKTEASAARATRATESAEPVSLERYHQKRRFNDTPEPRGRVPRRSRAGRGGRYIVQRHRATALHYDVRLEMGGVLASWAVPKGPSLDPTEKRLAVHDEDHPLEYFDFEGVIPRAQYGAGVVIVWDWGRWQPDPSVEDAAAAIGTGELKFRLEGEKLHGAFVLVRTSPRKPHGKDEWLLIHRRDEDVVEDWDAEDYPASVKSGRTNDDVAAGSRDG
jgi:bifunctional non-homologous end joining protein LigD